MRLLLLTIKVSNSYKLHVAAVVPHDFGFPTELETLNVEIKICTYVRLLFSTWLLCEFRNSIDNRFMVKDIV